MAVVAFGSANFGSIVGVLESKFDVLTKLVVLTAADFCEFVDVWTASSIISTTLGLG